MIYKFLWNGPDKTCRNSTINSIENGGLKMIDLDTFVKALQLWIKRLFDNTSNVFWKRYLSYCLEDKGGAFFTLLNYSLSETEGKLPIFYSELLKNWQFFRDNFETDNTAKQIIWNNKDIQINNKEVFYKRYFEKNIVH